MSALNDGGPAFPREEMRVTGGKEYVAVQPGMSLRDWFAGQALAGLLANRIKDTPEKWAAVSYVLADAMLAAREKEPGA